jgi:hypothetical protein
MTPLDEFAAHLGHVYVQWQREHQAKNQLDGAVRKVAAELQQAQEQLANVKAEAPAAEPPASVLCGWCDTAVVVPEGQARAYALGNHVEKCAGSPTVAGRAEIARLEALVQEQREAYDELFLRFKALEKPVDDALGPPCSRCATPVAVASVLCPECWQRRLSIKPGSHTPRDANGSEVAP